MQMVVCSVFDTAVGAYMRPFFAPAPGAAIRAFEDDASNAESVVSRHPEDYALFLLGRWDDQSGKFEQEETPVCLCRAHELVAASRQVDGKRLVDFDKALEKGKANGDELNAS